MPRFFTSAGCSILWMLYNSAREFVRGVPEASITESFFGNCPFR
jgi:hypothetical protein